MLDIAFDYGTTLAGVKDKAVHINLSKTLGNSDYQFLRQSLLPLEMQGWIFRETSPKKGYCYLTVWSQKQPERDRKECIGVYKTIQAEKAILN